LPSSTLSWGEMRPRRARRLTLRDSASKRRSPPRRGESRAVARWRRARAAAA
jgi:hypothetical protein